MGFKKAFKLAGRVAGFIAGGGALLSAIFLAYKKRVLGDGGTISSDSKTNATYSNIPQQDAVEFAWLGVAGSKKRVSSILKFFTKLFSMLPIPAYGDELVVNGGFVTNVDEWISTRGNSAITWESGSGRATLTATATDGIVQQLTGLVVGGRYGLKYDYDGTGTTSNCLVRVATNQALNTGNIDIENYPSGTIATGEEFFFTATATTMYFGTLMTSQTTGAFHELDNVSIREVLAKDATQTTEADQPYVSGNIAPTENEGLNNPNGDTNYMTHPEISFADGESWSVTVNVNHNGKSDGLSIVCGESSTANGLYINYNTGLFRFFNGASYPLGTTQNDKLGKNAVYTFSHSGTILSVYVNGVYNGQVASASNINFNAIITVLSSRALQGKLNAHFIHRAALTPTEIADFSDYLQTLYPPIPSVEIGGDIESVVNGDFSDGANNWTLLSATVQDEYATIGLLSGEISQISQLNVMVIGGVYKLSYKILRQDAGTLTLATPNTAMPSTIGDHSITFTATSTALNIKRTSGATDIDIDNISVKEVSQQWQTSNVDMVATPIGTVIPEVTADANVEKITNGDFESGSDDWIVSGEDATHIATFNGSTLRYQSDTTSPVLSLSQAGSLTVGKWYKITTNVSSYISGSIKSNLASDVILASNVGETIIYVLSNSTTFDIVRNTTNVDITIDNVSVEEVGWAGSQDLYDGLILQGESVYDATKAAAMWCYYNNDSSLGATYGKLYNWFAVSLMQLDIDTFNLTGDWGYHVPSEAEFTTLQTALGGSAVAGGKMKIEGTDYMTGANIGSDNSSGFTFIATGRRSENGTFSTYPFIQGTDKQVRINGDSTEMVIVNLNKQYGLSLRLLKD